MLHNQAIDFYLALADRWPVETEMDPDLYITHPYLF